MTPIMKKTFLLLFITIFINSCVSYKVKNLNENIEKTDYQNIEFIKNVALYSSKKEVGTFNVVDLKKEWNEIKSNLIKLAKDNFANAIVVEKFELAGKGVKGRLYQIDITELDTIENSEKNRKLYIFRDELGSILTTHFRTELSINEKTEKLKDRTYELIDLNEDQDLITIAINGKGKALELTEGTNYFWISRQINANQFGGTGMNIEIGGQKILKLNDPEMGEIWREPLDVLVQQLLAQSEGQLSLQDLQEVEEMAIRMIPGFLAGSILFGTVISLLLARWWQSIILNPALQDLPVV